MTLCEFFEKFNEWLKEKNKHFAPKKTFDNELLEVYNDFKYTIHNNNEPSFDIWVKNSEYAQISLKDGYKNLFEEYKTSIKEFCN